MSFEYLRVNWEIKLMQKMSNIILTDKVLLQLGLEESLPYHYVVGYKTIHMYLITWFTNSFKK